MQIRLANRNDSSSVVECDEYVKADTTRADAIRAAIAQRRCLIAVEGNAALGYCVFHEHFFNHRFIELIVVRAPARRRGIGSLLVDAASATSPTHLVFSSSNSSNLASRALLIGRKFHEIGQLTGLDDGDPEVFFRHNKTVQRK